ncbi:MAG: DnaJ domain-containing protein [Sphingobacteriales bacterium]|nr:DnaJ domain-containing protein [Sphingobacteriales bacterium]
MKDYYKVLGLRFGAPSSEIRAAFRRLALKYHPDKNPGNKKAEQQFVDVNEAYEILSSEYKRIQYHASYNESLNDIYLNRLPQESLKDKYRRNPTYVPKQPVAPASKLEIKYPGLQVALFIFFIGTMVYLLFQASGELKERERKRKIIAQQPAADSMKKSDTVSMDEFYTILSREFLASQDSTLLNANIDSLKHVYDSLQQLSKN